MVGDIVGIVAICFSLITSIPQIVRILVSKSTAGVSLVLWQLMLGNFIGWTFHGLQVRSLTLWGSNGALAVLAFIVFAMVVVQRKTPLWKAALLPVLVVLSLVGAELCFGSGGFATLVIFPQGVGMAAQIVTLARDEDISGISKGYLLISFLAQICWLSWAWIVDELAVKVSSTSQGTICLLCLLSYYLRIWGVLKPIAKS